MAPPHTVAADVIQPVPGERNRAASQPPEEGHHILRHDPDGTVVRDDDVLDARSLASCDRGGRLPQVVAAAAGNVMRQPLLDVGQPSRQAGHPQRQPEAFRTPCTSLGLRTK